MAEGDTSVEKLKAQFPEAVLEEKEFRGETTVELRAEALAGVCRFLRDDPELKYEMLTTSPGLIIRLRGWTPVSRRFTSSTPWSIAAVCA